MNKPSIASASFGTTSEGVAVESYTLRNALGASVRIITFGATVTELWMPDRRGELADVVLGFDNLRQYETESPYFGCIVGRTAFRIFHGKYMLDGQPCQLDLNAGAHHMHGGSRGFSHVVWQAEAGMTDDGPSVRLRYRSPDGDQGYPGNLDAVVVYTLTNENSLRIDCTASTDRPTPINLTHHSYFNLAGAGRGDVLDHVLQLDSDRWCLEEETEHPEGRTVLSADTPYDFTRPTAIGAWIDGTDPNDKGYDKCHLLCRSGDGPIRVATLSEPSSGRSMDVLTNQPSIVLYTANYLDGSLRGKGGLTYSRRAGVCLETGLPPNAVNLPQFPGSILRPGQTYHHTCIYRFSADGVA